MSNIIAFAGSNSKASINQELVTYVATTIGIKKVDLINLASYQLPMYSIDHENQYGIPTEVSELIEKIKYSKGIIISLPEHNGNFTAFFKNIFDWMSRVEKNVWGNLPMLLMATSPGARGGASVLEIAKNSFSRMGASSIEEFSFPSFYDNFKNNIIINSDLDAALKLKINNFERTINQTTNR